MTRKEHNRNLILAALCLSLGLVLPFLTAQIPEIGRRLLPMHLPVFLSGLICGMPYGALVGFVTPLLRALMFGQPVLYPDAVAMAFELMSYGLLIALFQKLFKKKTLLTLYLSLIASMLAGRVVWAGARMLLLALGDIPFSFKAFIAVGFVNALPGILLQLVLVPLLMAAIDKNYRPSRKTVPTPTHANIPSYTVEDALTLILDALKERPTPRLIAIDGRAAAGKTTLAEALARVLSCPIAHTDDYLLPFDKRSQEQMEKIGGHFDAARFDDEILRPFSEKTPLHYRPFSCQTGKISEGALLPVTDTLIVEGAYCQHPALFADYTLTVFCTIDKDEQARRILFRNPEKADAFFDTWIPKEEAYIAAVHPDRTSDLVFSLTAFPD